MTTAPTILPLKRVPKTCLSGSSTSEPSTRRRFETFGRNIENPFNMFISDTASYNLFIGILLVLLVNPNDEVGMYGQDLKVDTGLTVMSD